MSVKVREVKNMKNSAGGRTGRPGLIYDVSIRYEADGEWRTYTKRGFLSSEEARLHDQEMTIRLFGFDDGHRTMPPAKQTRETFMF